MRLCSQVGDDSLIVMRVQAAQYKYASIIIIISHTNVNRVLRYLAFYIQRYKVYKVIFSGFCSIEFWMWAMKICRESDTVQQKPRHYISYYISENINWFL